MRPDSSSQNSADSHKDVSLYGLSLVSRIIIKTWSLPGLDVVLWVTVQKSHLGRWLFNKRPTSRSETLSKGQIGSVLTSAARPAARLASGSGDETPRTRTGAAGYDVCSYRRRAACQRQRPLPLELRAAGVCFSLD